MNPSPPSLGEPPRAPAPREGLGCDSLGCDSLGCDSRTGTLNRALAGWLERGLLECTIPDKPTCKHQHYRLTNLRREHPDSEEPHNEG